MSRYSIMKYEILDGLSGWFRDWVIIACVTRCVCLYVSVSDLWTVQVLEIVEMNSCIVWLLSCFVVPTEVNSVLWDMQYHVKIHLLGYYAVLVGENTWQLFSDYEPFTNSKRCHASEDLNLGIICCCTAVISNLLSIMLFALDVRQQWWDVQELMQLAVEIRVLWWWRYGVCIQWAVLYLIFSSFKHHQWMLFVHSKLTVGV